MNVHKIQNKNIKINKSFFINFLSTFKCDI